MIEEESIVKKKSSEKYFENFNLSRSHGNIFKGLKQTNKQTSMERIRAS